MQYVLGIGLFRKKFKTDPIIRVSINDILLDEFTLDHEDTEEITYAKKDLFDPTIYIVTYNSEPYKRPITISKNISTENSIIREIRSDQSEVSLITIDELDVEVIEIMPEPGSRVTQFPLSKISFPKESIVGVINHHGHLSIARGDSQLSHEDTVLVFAKNKALTKLRKLFNKP